MYAENFQCSAATTCSYSGTYQIYSKGCSGQLVSVSAYCYNTNNVYLRYPNQSPGHRSHFNVNATAVVGSAVAVVAPSAIVSEQRIAMNCSAANLAASQHLNVPVVAGPVWKMKLIPVDDTCDTVWIAGLNSSGSDRPVNTLFLSVNSDCTGFHSFQAPSESANLQFVLLPPE